MDYCIGEKRLIDILAHDNFRSLANCKYQWELMYSNLIGGFECMDDKSLDRLLSRWDEKLAEIEEQIEAAKYQD